MSEFKDEDAEGFYRFMCADDYHFANIDGVRWELPKIAVWDNLSGLHVEVCLFKGEFLVCAGFFSAKPALKAIYSQLQQTAFEKGGLIWYGFKNAGEWKPEGNISFEDDGKNSAFPPFDDFLPTLQENITQLAAKHEMVWEDCIVTTKCRKDREWSW